MTDDPADMATDIRKFVADRRVRLDFDDWSLTGSVATDTHYQPAAFVEGQFSPGELWVNFEASDDECDRLELPSQSVQVVAKEYRIGMWRRPNAAVCRYIYDEDDSEIVVGEEWDDLGRIEGIEVESR